MSKRISRRGIGTISIAEIDIENSREYKREAVLDWQRGYELPRCSVCGGRREHPVLQRVCTYCGAQNIETVKEIDESEGKDNGYKSRSSVETRL